MKIQTKNDNNQVLCAVGLSLNTLAQISFEILEQARKDGCKLQTSKPVTLDELRLLLKSSDKVIKKIQPVKIRFKTKDKEQRDLNVERTNHQSRPTKSRKKLAAKQNKTSSKPAPKVVKLKPTLRELPKLDTTDYSSTVNRVTNFLHAGGKLDQFSAAKPIDIRSYDTEVLPGSLLLGAMLSTSDRHCIERIDYCMKQMADLNQCKDDIPGIVYFYAQQYYLMDSYLALQQSSSNSSICSLFSRGQFEQEFRDYFAHYYFPEFPGDDKLLELPIDETLLSSLAKIQKRVGNRLTGDERLQAQSATIQLRSYCAKMLRRFDLMDLAFANGGDPRAWLVDYMSQTIQTINDLYQMMEQGAGINEHISNGLLFLVRSMGELDKHLPGKIAPIHNKMRNAIIHRVTLKSGNLITIKDLHLQLKKQRKGLCKMGALEPILEGEWRPYVNMSYEYPKQLIHLIMKFKLDDPSVTILPCQPLNQLPKLSELCEQFQQTRLILVPVELEQNQLCGLAVHLNDQQQIQLLQVICVHERMALGQLNEYIGECAKRYVRLCQLSEKDQHQQGPTLIESMLNSCVINRGNTDKIKGWRAARTEHLRLLCQHDYLGFYLNQFAQKGIDNQDVANSLMTKHK